jgi:hypothetical protein
VAVEMHGVGNVDGDWGAGDFLHDPVVPLQ